MVHGELVARRRACIAVVVRMAIRISQHEGASAYWMVILSSHIDVLIRVEGVEGGVKGGRARHRAAHTVIELISVRTVLTAGAEAAVNVVVTVP